jgi:hypothetical protein
VAEGKTVSAGESLSEDEEMGRLTPVKNSGSLITMERKFSEPLGLMAKFAGPQTGRRKNKFTQ